jgi:hypothetical protein
MSINENWARWILASVSTYFDANRGGLPMFIEGQERDTKDEKSLIELRIDGPWYTERTKGDWRVYVEINVLVQTTMLVRDFHNHHRNMGIVAAAYGDIQIFRCGDGPDDDDSLLGCLKLMQNDRKRERVVTSNFGQIEPHIRVQQATLEGHFEMFLTV